MGLRGLAVDHQDMTMIPDKAGRTAIRADHPHRSNQVAHIRSGLQVERAADSGVGMTETRCGPCLGRSIKTVSLT